ncbi:hypothetical protein [Streptomyces sp. ZS0098]|uniref:hypothetical protein n=1 Tax=Streptomyces sp. ZS0098 TaxID=1904044 RepID=UPI001604A4C0|nr:hypothetical protein [Streptomyces sp. ZS0098]
MRWPLTALVLVLVFTFPNLLGLVAALVAEPVIVAFALGAAAVYWPRRRAATRTRRGRR